MKDYISRQQKLDFLNEDPFTDTKKTKNAADSSHKTKSKRTKKPSVDDTNTTPNFAAWVLSIIIVVAFLGFLAFLHHDYSQRTDNLVDTAKATPQQTTPTTATIGNTATSVTMPGSVKNTQAPITSLPKIEKPAASHTAAPIVSHSASHATTTKTPPVHASAPKPKFDFYTILPGHKTAALSSTTTQPAHPVAPKTQLKGPVSIIVNTYMTETAANEMRARLLLMGFSSVVIELTTHDQYQVSIGPFAKPQDAQQTLSTLKTNKLNGVLVSNQPQNKK